MVSSEPLEGWLKPSDDPAITYTDLTELYQTCIKDEHNLLEIMWDAAFTAYLEKDYDHFGEFTKAAHGLEKIFMADCMNNEYHVAMMDLVYEFITEFTPISNDEEVNIQYYTN